MGNTNSSLEICFPAELVSRDGTFNFKRLSELAKDVKLPADGGHYTVVSIVGPQSSGKSTLMNHIFGTEFKEMDFKEGRNPTTKGIWVAGMKRAKGSILVIDTEGTDGEEREDDTSFESQTVAFVLAISDTVIINLMCSDIGHRLPVIKTLFEVKIRKFAISHKISLQFVLRDKTKTPLDKLREQLMQQLEKIWCKMTMPQAQIKTDLKDHFHIEVTTMSNYETDEIQFMNEAAMLGERIIHSSTTSQCGLGWASASEFLANASRLWDDIKNDKDLDLPSYSIMLAEVRCKQIFEEKYKSFLKDEEELRSRNVQQFGKKSNKLIASYLSKYDKETLYYDEAVRDGRREQLFEKLLEIKDATLEKCKKADYTDHFQRQLDNHFADFKIDHTNWNFKTEQRSKFEQDIKACLEKPEFDPLKFQNKKKKKSGRNGSDLARRIIDVVIRYVVSIFPQAIPFLGDGKFVMAVVDAVRDGRREQLVENLLEVILPICVTVLQHIKDATLEKFKRADHTDHILRELQNRFAAAKLFCVTTTHPTMEEKKKSNEEEGKADAAEKAQQGQERNRFLGLFSNKIQRHELNPGDHIYSWRYNYLYAHHGIYVGDEMVIHFTRSADHEIGTGTVLDRIIFSSSPTNSKFSEAPCPRCGDEPRVSGVISSCLECFLHGGELYKFQYGVSPAVFLAKVRGGTCTLAASDPAEHVIHRAEFLLQNGFGGYDLFKNNCEDFAIYCKTDLLVFTSVSLGRSGQAASFVAAATAIGSSPLRFMTTSFPGLGAVGCGIYCISRLVSDIGIRRDVKKIPVEKLIARSGLDESNAETGVPNSGASEKLKDD